MLPAQTAIERHLVVIRTGIVSRKRLVGGKTWRIPIATERPRSAQIEEAKYFVANCHFAAAKKRANKQILFLL